MVALAALALDVTTARAVIVGGGGSATTDCFSVFSADVNHPAARPRHLRCTDGDPACDADGIVNGQCEFAVGVCANSSFNAGACSPVDLQSITVDHAADNGDPKFDPDLQALQNRIDSQIEAPTSDVDVCTSPSTIRVRLLGPMPGKKCKAAQKRIRLTARSVAVQGKFKEDVDQINLRCDPPPVCDPQELFSGTYDRVQKQVFNQHCAVSGCHDSQSGAGSLLLEVGASYLQTVDHIPTNPVAGGLGWKRIDATNRSLETSYLFRKITGDLNEGTGDLGRRMPRGRPKLPPYLIDLMRLWIVDGAPATGWSPGSDQ